MFVNYNGKTGEIATSPIFYFLKILEGILDKYNVHIINYTVIFYTYAYMHRVIIKIIIHLLISCIYICILLYIMIHLCIYLFYIW